MGRAASAFVAQLLQVVLLEKSKWDIYHICLGNTQRIKGGIQEEIKVEIGVRYRQVFLFDSFPSDVNGMRQRDKAVGKALSGLVWS